MNTSILLAAVSGSLFGIQNTIGGKATRILGEKGALFYRTIMTTIALGIIFGVSVLMGQSYGWSWESFGIISLVSVLSFGALLSLYTSMRTLDVGIAGTVISTSVIYTTIITVLFFGATINFTKGLAIVLGLAGVGLISIKDFRHQKSTKGIVLAILASLFWGLAYAIYQFASTVMGVYLSVFVSEFIILLCIVGYLLVTKNFNHKTLPIKQAKKHINLFLFISIMSSVAMVLRILSQNTGVVYITEAVAVVFQPLASLVSGRLLFQEKLIKQQLAGACTILLSIIFINF